MKNIDGFSTESIYAVNQLLYAEGQPNPFEGKCGQAKLRKQNKGQRTPAQQEADRQRSLNNRGQDVVPSAKRSEAAVKAAETKRRCKGLPDNPQTAATA